MKSISREEIDRVIERLRASIVPASLGPKWCAEAIDLIEALAQAPALLAQTNHAATCIYCGEAVIYDTRAEADMHAAHQRLVDHDQHCPRNPLVAQVEELHACLAHAVGVADTVLQGGEDPGPDDFQGWLERSRAALLTGLKCPDGDTCRHSLQGETCSDPLCQTGDAS